MADQVPDSCPRVRYRISAEDRLIEVNDGWSTFARANGGSLLRTTVIGRPIWQFISDPTTVYLYQSMVHRVRQTGTPTRFCFRCDGPARRRLLSMQISHTAAGAVEFAVDPVREDGRPALLLLDAASPRGDRMLTMCGWCARARISDARWVELDVAVRDLGLFREPPLPRLSHGICSSCAEQVIAGLGGNSTATTPVTLGAF